MSPILYNQIHNNQKELKILWGQFKRVCDLSIIENSYTLISNFAFPFCKKHIYNGFLKNIEWGTSYWLEQCLEGKKSLHKSFIDDECNEFLIGSMVVKGKYLTLDENSRKTNSYVFMDTNEVNWHITLQT